MPSDGIRWSEFFILFFFRNYVFSCRYSICTYEFCDFQADVDELCAMPVLPVDVQLRDRRFAGQDLLNRDGGDARHHHSCGHGSGEPERPRSYIRHAG